MTREELIKSPIYWTSLIQDELYRRIEAYMTEHNMNKAQLAEQLGCSRGYVTQLLNGDYDHKLSKLVELSLAIGMAPSIHFEELEQVDKENKFESNTLIDNICTDFSKEKTNFVAIGTANSSFKYEGYQEIIPLKFVV